MRGRFCLLSLAVLSLLVAACAERFDPAASDAANPARAAELIRQADALYVKRAENPNNIANAVELLRQARLSDGASFEAAWKTAQFSYFQGSVAAEEKDRSGAFKNGAAAGKAATALQPARAEGYFWTGANLGGQARASVFDAAANVNDIRSNMQKVIELQPGYQGATAFIILARIELETRGMLGGDAQKAAGLLETALKHEKNNPMIYVSLAEAYLHTNRKPEARQMLAASRRIPKNPEFAQEQREVEDLARRVEAKL